MVGPAPYFRGRTAGADLAGSFFAGGVKNSMGSTFKARASFSSWETFAFSKPRSIRLIQA